MNSTRYDLSRAELKTLVCGCAAAAEAAAIALARFDERLSRADPVLAEGARQRGHAFEAQALVGLGGGLCPLEDLVLHDAGMDVRSPTRDITRAAAMLEERRRLARREPAEILGTSALRLRLGIAGRAEPDATERGATTAMAPIHVAAPWDRIDPDEDADQADEDELDREDADDSDDPAFAAIDALLARTRKKLDAWNDLSSDAGRKSLTLRDPGYDAAGRFAAWLKVLEEGRGLPAALAGALALDSWLWLEPSERAGELGFAYAATVLRQRGLAVAHSPGIGLGLRRGKFRWSPHQTLSVRIAGLLDGFAEAAAFGQADLDRLSLARDVMLRKCEGRRGNSKLAELVDLFVASAAGDRAMGGGAAKHHAAGGRGHAQAARRQPSARADRAGSAIALGEFCRLRAIFSLADGDFR